MPFRPLLFLTAMDFHDITEMFGISRSILLRVYLPISVSIHLVPMIDEIEKLKPLTAMEDT
jgi:hypothetical protein